MTTVYDNFQELLGTMSTKLEELEGQLDEAKTHANYANSEADSACDQANEARQSAENAVTEIEAAEARHSDLYAVFTDLCAELDVLRRLGGDTQSPEQVTGLEADIRKHKANVVMLKKKGKSPSDIATNLGISTILVDQILRRLAAA